MPATLSGDLRAVGTVCARVCGGGGGRRRAVPALWCGEMSLGGKHNMIIGHHLKGEGDCVSYGLCEL